MQKFSGMQYLQIDIANNFGLDKLNWDDRLSWFAKNENSLMALLPQAEEPALYFAGVQAYQSILRGKPSGYPVSFDATSSGLQILACLTGDRKAAEVCNVVNTGNRMDAYTVIYKAMVDLIGEEGKITRSDTKQAIMTALYGSTAIPKQVFGEGNLLNIFYQMMKKHAPGAWELNVSFMDMWQPDNYSHDWVLPDNFHVHIKVMNQRQETVHFLNEKFDTFYKVNEPTDEGRSIGANTVHSIDGMIVREIIARCDYNTTQVEYVEAICISALQNMVVGIHPHNDENSIMVKKLWDHYTKSGYLSARILNYIHLHNIDLVNPNIILELIKSLPKKPFEVISIHDCFRCLPNYVNDLREQYILQLHLIAKSDMLSFLVSQIMGRNITVEKLDPFLHLDILSTEYALS